MKSKQAAASKKHSIVVKDLKTRKNPTGGITLNFAKIEYEYGHAPKPVSK